MPASERALKVRSNLNKSLPYAASSFKGTENDLFRIFEGPNWNVNNFHVLYCREWILNTVATLSCAFCPIFSSCGS